MGSSPLGLWPASSLWDTRMRRSAPRSASIGPGRGVTHRPLLGAPAHHDGGVTGVVDEVAAAGVVRCDPPLAVLGCGDDCLYAGIVGLQRGCVDEVLCCARGVDEYRVQRRGVSLDSGGVGAGAVSEDLLLLECSDADMGAGIRGFVGCGAPVAVDVVDELVGYERGIAVAGGDGEMNAGCGAEAGDPAEVSIAAIEAGAHGEKDVLNGAEVAGPGMCRGIR